MLTVNALTVRYKKKIKVFIGISKIISIFLFLYVILQLDFKELNSIFKTVRLTDLALYSLAFFICFALKTLRWQMIQKFYTKKSNFWLNLKLNIESLVLGFVTPSKVGDAVKILLLEKYFRIEKKTGLYIYLYDRIQDLVFMVLMALVGIVFILKMPGYGVVTVGLAAGILAFFTKNYWFRLLARFMPILNSFYIPITFELRILFINCIIFFFQFIQVWLLAIAFGCSISFLEISAIYSISTLLTYLPISILGLGIRESSYIYLLAKFGISKEIATSISLLDGVFCYAVFIIILNFINLVFLNKRVVLSQH